MYALDRARGAMRESITISIQHRLSLGAQDALHKISYSGLYKEVTREVGDRLQYYLQVEVNVMRYGDD